LQKRSGGTHQNLKLGNRISAKPRVDLVSLGRPIVVDRAPEQSSNILHRQRMVVLHGCLESVPIERTDFGKNESFQFLTE